MRRVAMLLLAGALAVPGVASAQSPSPMASTGPLVGYGTMDLCLSITGPVVLLTPEVLTQGIIDGTFTIEGLSEGCSSGEPEASEQPSGSDDATETAEPSEAP